MSERDAAPDRSWIADAATSYDRVATPYHEIVRDGLDGHPLEQALLGVFAAQVRRHGPDVLDAGCGPGTLGRDLVGHGSTVTAVASLRAGRAGWDVIRSAASEGRFV